MMFDVFTELEKFNKIIFNEADHSYYIDGQECISVTSLISKFKKPFNTDLIAKKYAQKNGLDYNDVIDEWELKGKTASMKGSEVHKYAENIFFNKHYQVDESLVSKELITQVDNFRKDSINRLIPVRAELIVGDPRLLVCGMIDKLFYNVMKGCLQIWDYKTNKDISKFNKYGNRMTNGLSSLHESEFNVYSLQTTVYKRIIERNTNLRLGDSYVVWLNESNDNYKVIKMDYMERESDIIFDSLGV
jgi:hypothetical protein